MVYMPSAVTGAAGTSKKASASLPPPTGVAVAKVTCAPPGPMSSKSSGCTVEVKTGSEKVNSNSDKAQSASSVPGVGGISSYNEAVEPEKSMEYPSRLFVQFMTTSAYVVPANTGKSALNGGPDRSPGPFEFPVPPSAVEMPVGPFMVKDP